MSLFFARRRLRTRTSATPRITMMPPSAPPTAPPMTVADLGLEGAAGEEPAVDEGDGLGSVDVVLVESAGTEGCGVNDCGGIADGNGVVVMLLDKVVGSGASVSWLNENTPEIPKIESRSSSPRGCQSPARKSKTNGPGALSGMPLA